MRMWAINPSKLCNKHLLGEHVEMHMFAGTIKKKISIKGYIEKGLVNPQDITKRHKELEEEMIKRGMNHKSVLDFDSSNLPNIPVNKRNSQEELIRRCKECRKLMVL